MYWVYRVGYALGFVSRRQLHGQALKSCDAYLWRCHHTKHLHSQGREVVTSWLIVSSTTIPITLLL